MNHVGDRNFHEIHSCENCNKNTINQVLETIKREINGKQFLIPCSYIEDNIVYRIGLATSEGKVHTNYVWEVNEYNYNLFIVNIKKAYGVNLPKAKNLSSRQMDENLFNFFEELYMRYDHKEVYARHSFKLNGFTVVI